MVDLEYYSYTCAHLWYLWHREKLTGKQILDRTLEMQKWLDENCCTNMKRSFAWAKEYTNLPFDYNVEYSGYKFSNNTIALANCLYFKYSEDLLAFRLRWGIQDTVCRL